MLLTSCTNSVYLHNLQGNTFTQCSIPNLYFTSHLGARLDKATQEAFEYWNSAIGDKIFVYGGEYTSDDYLAPFIIVKIDDFHQPFSFDKHYKCYKIKMVFMNSGCLMGAQISINSKCVKGSKHFNTQIRHSIGNILGLANNQTPGTLMSYSNDNAQDPIDASPEDIQRVKNLFKVK